MPCENSLNYAATVAPCIVWNPWQFLVVCNITNGELSHFFNLPLND